MTIQLPETIERSILAAVESGRFRSVVDAVAAAWLAFDDPPGPGGQGGQGARTGEAPRTATDDDDGREASTSRPIWEQILDLTADVPEEEWERLPVDGAEQHDHYLYGTPKRTPGG